MATKTRTISWLEEVEDHDYPVRIQKIQPRQLKLLGLFFTLLKLVLYESLRLSVRACTQHCHKQQSPIELAHAQ